MHNNGNAQAKEGENTPQQKVVGKNTFLNNIQAQVNSLANATQQIANRLAILEINSQSNTKNHQLADKDRGILYREFESLEKRIKGLENQINRE